MVILSAWLGILPTNHLAKVGENPIWACLIIDMVLSLASAWPRGKLTSCWLISASGI
jgi:hypothetical protein